MTPDCSGRWVFDVVLFSTIRTDLLINFSLPPCSGRFLWNFWITLLTQGYQGLWRDGLIPFGRRVFANYRPPDVLRQLLCLHLCDEGTGTTGGFLKLRSYRSLANSCHMGTDGLSQVILICHLPKASHNVLPYWSTAKGAKTKHRKNVSLDSFFFRRYSTLCI